MKISKSTLWFSWFVLVALSFLSGAVIMIVSRLGDRFNTSVLEQVRMGDPPILTFVGLALVLLPMGITLILVRGQE